MNKLVTLSALLGLAVTSYASIWDVNFAEGGLSGANAVPPNASKATGGELGPVGVRYDDETNLLEINLAYGVFGWSPLESGYTGAGIYLGAPGENGPLVVPLSGMHVAFGSRQGTFQGASRISEQQEAILFAGNFYISVNSVRYPTGEIRGQLAVVPEPGTWALMAAGLAGLFWLRRK